MVGREGGGEVAVGKEGGEEVAVGREGGGEVAVGREGGGEVAVGREGGGEVVVGREGGGEVAVGREGGGEVAVGREGGGEVTVKREGGGEVTVGREGGAGEHQGSKGDHVGGPSKALGSILVIRAMRKHACDAQVSPRQGTSQSVRGTHVYEENSCDVAHPLTVAHLSVGHGVGVKDIVEPPLAVLEGRGKVRVAGEGATYIKG